MSNRTNAGQSKHNKGVKAGAKYYASQGFKVKAHIPDYATPKKIGNRIPDIQATKTNRKGAITREVIVEYETPLTIRQDTGQRKVFRNYANKNNKTTFRTKVVK